MLLIAQVRYDKSTMSEFGEVQAAIEPERKIQVPEQFDHRSIRFDSPEADIKLGQIQERVTSERKNPSIIDLLDIVRCEVEDIDDQQKVVLNTKAMSSAKNELKAIQNTLLHVAAGEVDQIKQSEKDKVTNYLDRHMQRWEVKGSLLDTDDPKKAEAIENQKIFKTLRENVFIQKAFETYLDEGAEEIENTANGATPEFEAAKEEPEKLEKIEMYEQFKPEARTAYAYLKSFRDKEITLGDVHEVLNFLEDDISAEEREYIEKHPGWEDKKNAVSAANIIYTQKVNEVGEKAVENDTLYATVNQSGTASASWEKPKMKHESSKQYAFTLKKDAYDDGYVNYFGEHKYNVEVFDKWRDSINRGKKALQNIQLGEQISLNEKFILSRFVDILRDAVPEDTSEETTKDEKTIDTVAKLVHNIPEPRPQLVAAA